jgi:hypothetical protein
MVRILFCFDPWRSAILLVAGDKSGRWSDWYHEAIPMLAMPVPFGRVGRSGEGGLDPVGG